MDVDNVIMITSWFYLLNIIRPSTVQYMLGELTNRAHDKKAIFSRQQTQTSTLHTLTPAWRSATQRTNFIAYSTDSPLDLTNVVSHLPSSAALIKQKLLRNGELEVLYEEIARDRLGSLV